MKTAAIIVNYNTPEIISRAVNSIKNHVDEVVIVDHSDIDNHAYDECRLLAKKNPNIKDIKTHKNIGHGPGMNIGIANTIADIIIVMDSDAELRQPEVIEEMKQAISNQNVYGCGLVVNVNQHGATDPNGQYKYLHPFFAMVKRSVFLQHPEFINHGAPWLLTMKTIHGKLDVVNIPGIQKKAWHEHRRTRQIASPSWRKNWQIV